MDSIRIAEELNALEKIHVSKLREFQGNLKDLSKARYAKLKRSIEKHGIFIPVFVWEDKLLDGHQRLRVALTEEWDIEWPIIRISADSEEDAREKLLAISSQYGKVTQEGWDEFTAGLDESWLLESTHFDALPFVFDSDWLKENEEEWGKALGSLPEGDKAPFTQITFTLHDVQADKVKGAIALSKTLGDFDTPNENSNGNALDRICDMFLEANSG